jgi:uncharacterized protein (TIGR04255 family)
MKIEAFERVVYDHNPLAEVVCQVSFERLESFNDDDVATLRMIFANMGYSEAQQFGMTVGLPAGILVAVSGGQQKLVQQIRVDHFGTPDGNWKVSLSPDSISLTCSKYSGWNDFLPRMLDAVSTFVGFCSTAIPVRLGLRYKDVIEREPLGLEHMPWHELIERFLLGPMAPNALAEGQTPTEDEVESFVSQSVLKLDNSMLFLQNSLLRSIDGTRRAFMIDADFYNAVDLEPNLLVKPELLQARLHGLHENAGALFRRGITATLHHALHPR